MACPLSVSVRNPCEYMCLHNTGFSPSEQTYAMFLRFFQKLSLNILIVIQMREVKEQCSTADSNT